MNENQLLKTMESTGITTWSFDEINLALDNLLEKYKGKVYTEESYKSAKSDKQELNAINKRIEEKRKEYKKICLAPYNAIEDEIKALTKKINEQISEIDEYTKAVEEKEKTDKKLKIKEYYDAKSVILGEYSESLFEKLLNIKWLNKTFSEKNWKIEVQDAINKAESDIKAIKALGSAFEKVLTDKYCETVSLDTVMEYRDELERACEARNDVSAAAPVSVAATATDNTESGSADYTMLKVYASGDALFRLQDYMAMMGIKFEIC